MSDAQFAADSFAWFLIVVAAIGIAVQVAILITDALERRRYRRVLAQIEKEYSNGA